MRKMEIILDTKENCFLCLKRIPEAEMNELCLTNICRFLQINISDVILEGLKEGERDIDAFNYNMLQNTKCNFSVTLCSPCYGVSGKLSSIIHDLEVALLQVNYYSEVFQKILEKADVTSTATKKTDNSQSADARMVDHLRKEAKQKCFGRNRRVLATTSRLPLVRLNKLTSETVTTMTKKCALASITQSSALDDVGNNVDIIHSTNSAVKNEYSKSVRIADPSVSTGVFVKASLEIADISTQVRHFVTDHAENHGGKPHSLGKDNDYGTSLLNPVTQDNSVSESAGCHAKNLNQPKLFEGHKLMACATTINPTSMVTPSSALNDVGVDISYSDNSTVKYEFSESIEIVDAPIFTGVFVDESKPEINEGGTENTMGLRNDIVTDQDYKLAEKLITHQMDENDGMSGPNSDSLSVTVYPNAAGTSYDKSLSQLELSEDHHLMSCSESLNSNPTVSYPVVERVVMEDWIVCPNNQEPAESRILEDPLTGDDWNDGVVVEVETATCNENFSRQQIAEEEGQLVKKRKIDREENPNGPGLKYVTENRLKIITTTYTTKTIQGQFACYHCKKRFPRAVNLRRHVMGVHPEQIFLSYKPVHRSESHFAESCRKILEMETVGHSHKTKKAVPRQCSYCTETQRYKQSYLMHLVYSHTKIIGEKIKAFEDEDEQVEYIRDPLSADASNDLLVGLVKMENCNESCTKDVELEGRKSPPLSAVEEKIGINHCAKTSKGRFVCNHCKRSFPCARSLQFHLISQHADQLFLCYKPVQRTESQFADSCREIFQKEVVGYTNARRKTVPRQCAYCTNFHRYKQEYLKHLVFSHKNIIGEKIRASSTNHVPESSKRRLACNHCKKRFVDLRLHMMTFHPDQIFLSYKPAHRSESQFADSCRKILERETLGYSHNTMKAVPRPCSYCTKIPRYKQHYCRHLVYLHTKIIGEKIRAFENEESKQVGFFDGPLSGDAENELPIGSC